MLASFVTGEYTSIWEKISASETENWGVLYHKSESDCANYLEGWKSEKKVNIGCCFFHASRSIASVRFLNKQDISISNLVSTFITPGMVNLKHFLQVYHFPKESENEHIFWKL